MAINFPQGHMADRVLARLIKFARTQQPRDKVAAQGAQIDAALQQPVGDVAPMEGLDEAMVLKSLSL